MGGFLAQATQVPERDSAPLKELARQSHAGKVLAVCERAGGVLVLCRERERGLYPGGLANPANEGDKRAREHGTERFLKPTPDLADFAHAMEAELL